MIPCFGLGFSYYLWSLYGQLTATFAQKKQAIPTRIYSDIARIFPGQHRKSVEARLQSLSYLFEKTNHEIVFSLHEPEYPKHLLPMTAPPLPSVNARVQLQFSQEKGSPLESILLDGQSASELYLEPELVATLSPGGSEAQHEIRTYLKFEEIPSLMWKAIIAIEDQHFLEHNGFDPRGIMRALWINLRTLSFSQGGSTITQQLVKNLMARRTKNILKKINEVFLAILLEANFDKEHILERYLNEVYLGQVGPLEIHGVAEGGQYFFGKKLDELNLAEIALIAGLVRGPNYYSPYRYPKRAKERQQWVLKKMSEYGLLAEAEIETAFNQPIRLIPPQTSSSTKAPYFADFVKAELVRKLKDRMNEEEIIQTGFRVYTTLDTQMNTQAQETLRLGITRIEGKDEKLEGAVAAVEHQTGFVRVLVGGKNYAESNFNRILNMNRQVGSTFKPLVYLTAFEKQKDENGVFYSPAHPIMDAPWKLLYDHKRQSWAPKNYTNTFLGWMSYRKALSQSINVADARLGNEIGISSVKKLAERLGVQSSLPAVPSLALGVAELSPIEVLRVYANLANHGTQVDFLVIRGVTLTDGTSFLEFTPQSKQVMEPAPIDMLHSILQDVMTVGTAKSSLQLGFHRPSAGKTGTTNDYRDAWFAGYTPELTAVVWVGSDRAFSKTGRLTGAKTALPIWVAFMNEALSDQPELGFEPSPHLQQVWMDPFTGKKASSSCPRALKRFDDLLATRTCVHLMKMDQIMKKL